MIICPVCNKEMQCINHLHLRMHSLTIEEFKIKFPDYEMYSDEVKAKNKQNSLKGSVASKLACKKIAKENLEKKIEEFKKLGKRCRQCNELLEYTKEEKNFCNHSCAASYTNLRRVVTYTEQAKENHRLIGIKNAVNLNKCKKVKSAKVYTLVCEICKNEFFVNVTKKLNRTCSKDCRSKLYSQTNARENNTRTKSGYYKGTYCASSWELAFLVYSLDAGKNISRCNKTFNYLLNDKEHTYFPDFLIDDVIYEIKGREREDVVFKTEAVVKAGYEIQIIRRKDITPIIKDLQEKYQLKDLTQLYDK